MMTNSIWGSRTMKKMILVVMAGLMCSVSLCDTILQDGFEADSFEENGWDTSDNVSWMLSTGNWGDHGNYAWGGGSPGTKEDLVSGRITKDTGYVIQAYDIFTLTFDIRDLSGGIEFDGAVSAILTYVDNTGEHTLGGIQYHDSGIPFGWNHEMGRLTVVATPESFGYNLFVSFSGGNSSHNGTSAQRLCIDNVVIEQIPEPATMLLMGFGGLAVLKRRRA